MSKQMHEFFQEKLSKYLIDGMNQPGTGSLAP